MIKIITAVCFAFILVLSGCPYSGPDPEYKIDLSVSLDPAGSFPAGYGADTSGEVETLYSGKTVYFRMAGVDGEPYSNTVVNGIYFDGLRVTGGSGLGRALIAGATADLSKNTMYLGGRYRFTIFIDWNDSGDLDGGDLVFESYSILADRDENSDTDSELVPAEDYADAVVYSRDDYSIVILDPLSPDEGLNWVVIEISGDGLLVHPGE